MFVKPVNTDVGIREFSSSVYMLIRSQRRSHTHLFSDITAVEGDGGADIQRNLTSAQTDTQAGRVGSLLWLAESDVIHETRWRVEGRLLKRKQNTIKRCF